MQSFPPASYYHLLLIFSYTFLDAPEDCVPAVLELPRAGAAVPSQPSACGGQGVADVGAESGSRNRGISQVYPKKF